MAVDFGRSIRSGGLVVAAVGFFLTRFIVAGAVDFTGTATTYLITNLPPLILGFGLTLFGVWLAVSTLSEAYVRAIARWCVLGTSSMLAILAVTLVDPMAGRLMSLPPKVAANVLLGGAIGGTLTGIRSAQNQERRQELERQRDQATVLNRVLRDEVLNAVAVITGQINSVTGDTGIDDKAISAIKERTERIEASIGDIGFIVRTQSADKRTQTDLVEVLEGELQAARANHPAASFTTPEDFPPEAIVLADRDLATAIERLLGLAVDRSQTSPPEISIQLTTIGNEVTLQVTPENGELAEIERHILEARDISDHDDPRVDFRVSIIGLLVDRYAGHITVDRGSSPTITVTIPRAIGPEWGSSWETARNGVAPVDLRNATVAALIGGVVMGATLTAFTGDMPVIGALYGIQNIAVGWISHLFHSLVFGAVFAAIVSSPTVSRSPRSIAWCTSLGIGYGILLWLIAAGIVMPLWLSALGIMTPIPNLEFVSLFGHVLWGGILGSLYAIFPK